MSHQVSIIWSNLLQKALWGGDRFHRVAESIKSLQSLHHQTSQSLKSAQDHNRCIDEWLNGVGFRPFQQMRAQEMEEQWEVIESGSKKIERELSDIAAKQVIQKLKLFFNFSVLSLNVLSMCLSISRFIARSI